MQTLVYLLMSALQAPPTPDTIRIEVGSAALDGRVYAPHAALVRVRLGDSSRVTATWTNELTLGDSARRAVMRWVTKGTQAPGTGAETTWELRQTYDAQTLAPLTYSQSSSTGGSRRSRRTWSGSTGREAVSSWSGRPLGRAKWPSRPFRARRTPKRRRNTTSNEDV